MEVVEAKEGKQWQPILKIDNNQHKKTKKEIATMEEDILKIIQEEEKNNNLIIREHDKHHLKTFFLNFYNINPEIKKYDIINELKTILKRIKKLEERAIKRYKGNKVFINKDNKITISKNTGKLYKDQDGNIKIMEEAITDKKIIETINSTIKNIISTKIKQLETEENKEFFIKFKNCFYI